MAETPNTITIKRYRVDIKKGTFVKTAVPRYYIFARNEWFFSDIACPWTRAVTGTVVADDGNPDLIITAVGRGHADGEVTIDLTTLPR